MQHDGLERTPVAQAAFEKACGAARANAVDDNPVNVMEIPDVLDYFEAEAESHIERGDE